MPEVLTRIGGMKPSASGADVSDALTGSMVDAVDTVLGAVSWLRRTVRAAGDMVCRIGVRAVSCVLLAGWPGDELREGELWAEFRSGLIDFAVFGLTVRGFAGADGGASRFSGDGSGIFLRLSRPSLLNSAFPSGADTVAEESSADGWSSSVGGDRADSVVIGRLLGSGSASKYSSPDEVSKDASTNSAGSVRFRLDASNE